MPISAVDSIGPSIQRTRRMLFQPFDIGKWFTLGFCAFLASLAEGGGGNFNFPSGGGGRGGPAPRPPVPSSPFPQPPGFPSPPRGGSTGGGGNASPQDILDEACRFFLANVYWIIPVALLVLVLMVVIMWIRARGKFMFLDGVINNRAAVVEPWKRFRDLARSFFRFDLLITFGFFFVLFLIGIVAWLIARPEIRAQHFGGASVFALIAGIGLAAISAIAVVIAKAIAEDFLIPLMYLRGQPIGVAWGEFRERILPGSAGALVVFYVMKIVLGAAAAVIGILAVCATCCIGALPYVSSVLLLPLFVFFRLYSLYFLRQFGGEYNMIIELPPPPVRGTGFPVIQPPSPPSASHGGSI